MLMIEQFFPLIIVPVWIVWKDRSYSLLNLVFSCVLIIWLLYLFLSDDCGVDYKVFVFDIFDRVKVLNYFP